MNPSEIETFDQFLTVLSELPCEDKCNINNALFTQYLNLLRFTYDNMFHAANTVVNPTIYLIKKFVSENGTENAELTRLISFCISFPVSEAIVESWGSSITHLYNIKHNPGEHHDDLKEPCTIDKLVFIRLNGPPPGKSGNEELFEVALNLQFNSSYAKHFVNTSRFARAASKVVTNIVNSNVNVLPCFKK